MEIAFADLGGNNVPPWVPDTDLPVGRLTYYTILCGMFTSHYSDDDPDAVSRYGVGVMLPSRLILEALMTEQAQKQRREWDAERAAAKAREEPRLQDAGGMVPARHSGEFERFEDLTRKLVQVPKKELDEKRGESS